MASGEIWIFSHWLIMGRSWNWPDLRSQIYKIRDIHFEDVYTLLPSCEYHTVSSIGVALPLANPKSSDEVTSLNLSWWPDLRSIWGNFCTQCAELMSEQVCQMLWRYVPLFSCYLQKTWGGRGRNPPPYSARVNECCRRSHSGEVRNL